MKNIYTYRRQAIWASELKRLLLGKWGSTKEVQSTKLHRTTSLRLHGLHGLDLKKQLNGCCWLNPSATSLSPLQRYERVRRRVGF